MLTHICFSTFLTGWGGVTFLGKMCGEGSGCGLRAPGRGGTVSFMARVSEKIRITNLDPKSGFVSPQRVERYASFSPSVFSCRQPCSFCRLIIHTLWWPSGRVIINIKIAAEESGLFAVIRSLGETPNEWQQKGEKTFQSLSQLF